MARIAPPLKFSVFRSMVTLSGLHVYPIKSAAGLSLTSAATAPRGFQHDRRWMLVDRAGKFISQRTCPKLALVSVDIGDRELVITAPDHGSQTLPLQPSGPSRIPVEVWGDRCSAIPMPAVVSDWLSAFLGTPCQLVYMPEDCDRPVDHGQFAADRSDDADTGSPLVSFADAYPFLLISEASLADLNHRLAVPIPMNRFRPNLVVQNCDAFAEDGWSRIQIGDAIFRVAKPCSRCTITTVEQSTGQRGAEPLKTLATFRRWDGQIWFGQNLVQETSGVVRVGDAVKILA
ncbi:MAG: MOSC domain-containing protein [Elainellaceae cyanobacterium]